MSNFSENVPVIYTGPNVFMLNIQKFQVFEGGLPLHVKKAIEIIPEIEQLIVPVTELDTTRTKIERTGTNEHRIYYEIQKKSEKLKTERKAK